MAFTVNSFIYFGFANIYSTKILNLEDFQNQFRSGIYQYRILSGYLLLGIYHVLDILPINFELFRLKFLNPSSEPQMYVSLYILNTLFLTAFAAILVIFFESKKIIGSETEKILLAIILIFCIALSQFVIVPYDVSSYFLLVLFYIILVNYVQSPSLNKLVLLGSVLLISTLNRESSAISVAAAAVLLYLKYGLKKEAIRPVIVLGLIFVGTYLSLRFWSQSFSTNDGNLLYQNFTDPKNWLGALFSILLFTLSLYLSKTQRGIFAIILFHIIALPYILVCFYSGILYEVRLYLPLFISSVFIGRTKLLKTD